MTRREFSSCDLMSKRSREIKRKPIQLPNVLAKNIQKMCEKSKDLLSDMDTLFDVRSELVTHFVILQGGTISGTQYGETSAGITLKQIAIESEAIVISDYIPYFGPSRLKTIPCDRKSSNMTATRPDGSKFIVPFDHALTADGATNAYSIVTEMMPSMRQITVEDGINHIIVMPARMTKDGYCVILGICFRAGTSEMMPDEIERLNVANERVMSAVHEVQIQRSRGELRVNSSIMDRACSKWSLPSSFILKKKGILDVPMHISMSSKVEEEYNLPKGSEFTISKDSTHLFVTARSSDSEAMLLRLPFCELIDKNERLKSERINTTIDRNMGLKQNKEGISQHALRTHMERTNPQTRMGISLKLSSMCSTLVATEPNIIDGFRVVPNDGVAVVFHHLVPHLIFLLFAKYDPALRGERKVIRGKPTDITQRKRKTREMVRRRWEWGTDKIRYITHRSGAQKSKHFVDPFPRWNPISDPKTIDKYRKEGCRIRHRNGITQGWGLVEGHYRGINGDPINWDGTFNFGKTLSGPYSQKALRWLKYREELDGVKMTRSAEVGGELRLTIKGGYIFADGWCEENNTIYEFHGNVWHGNPRLFDDDERCHPHSDMTAKELFEKTIEREEAIKAIGKKVVSIWEDEWDAIEYEMNQEKKFE